MRPFVFRDAASRIETKVFSACAFRSLCTVSTHILIMVDVSRLLYLRSRDEPWTWNAPGRADARNRSVTRKQKKRRKRKEKQRSGKKKKTRSLSSHSLNRRLCSRFNYFSSSLFLLSLPVENARTVSKRVENERESSPSLSLSRALRGSGEDDVGRESLSFSLLSLAPVFLVFFVFFEKKRENECRASRRRTRGPCGSSGRSSAASRTICRRTM